MTARGDRVAVTCSHCGKVFSLMPSDHKKRAARKQTTAWFCRKACYDAWKTKKVKA